MESPESGMCCSPGASPKSDIDSASIAFGVMYQPRARIQRIDQFNCDTRLLREGHEPSEQAFHSELDDGLRLGFVQKSETSEHPSQSDSQLSLIHISEPTRPY